MLYKVTTINLAGNSIIDKLKSLSCGFIILLKTSGKKRLGYVHDFFKKATHSKEVILRRRIINWEEVISEIKNHELFELRFIFPDLVKAKKSGYRQWKMLCPFHDEKTPSFVYFETSGKFHCFGCSAAGSIIDYYARKKEITFGEAVQQLAKIFKIKFQWSKID